MGEQLRQKPNNPNLKGGEQTVRNYSLLTSKKEHTQDFLPSGLTQIPSTKELAETRVESTKFRKWFDRDQ